MKLGLVIDTTDCGLKRAKGINEEESWTRYIVDVRSAINGLQHFDGTEKIIYLVRFLGDKGYLLALIKSRPEGSGRGSDNVAAWIHIPAKCNISNEKTIDILECVKNAISTGTEKGTESLDKVFNNDKYTTNDVLLSALDSIVSKDEGNYAVRFYCDEDYSLKELLGKNIAQQEYGKYKGIIFIDKKLGIKANWEQLNFEPKKICRLKSPTQNDGFKAYLKIPGKDDVPFDKPIEVLEGTQGTVVWKKPGYSDIQKSFVAYDNDANPSSLTISPNEYRRIINRSDFHISAKDGTQIKDFKVHINDMILKDCMDIPESYFTNVTLNISAEGYEDRTIPNFDLTVNKNIELEKKLHHYVFDFPEYATKNNKEETLLIVKRYHKISKPPIEGYSVVGKIQECEKCENQLYYDHDIKYKLKYIGIGIISCLLAIMLYASWQAMDNYEFKLGWPPFTEVKQQESLYSPSADEENSETTVYENVDSINAVAYLEKNHIWHKDSLDKYDSTRGLFEELNEFKSDEIIKRKEILGSIERLDSIIQAFKEYSFDHHIGKEKNKGKYNSAKDKGIAINNYIKWISVEHEPEEPKEKQVTKEEERNKITGKVIKDGKQTSTGSTSSGTNNSKRGGIE